MAKPSQSIGNRKAKFKMSVATFKKLSSSIIKNASSYKTESACIMAIGRLDAAWKANGCFMWQRSLRDDATFECQCRLLEIQGTKRESQLYRELIIMAD